jgi:predicted HTH transcriptional regulator
MVVGDDDNNSNNSNSRSGVSSNDIRLKVSPSNFLGKDNAGLVRLLKTIQEAGKDGISTRKLCEQAFKTRNYGMRVINRAYENGYINRFGKNKRGHKTVNYLSDKGKGAAKSAAARRRRRRRGGG